MTKRILLILGLVFLLSACAATSQVYKTEEFQVTVPTGWVIETRKDKLPEDVSVAFFYREATTDQYYSVNVVEEVINEKLESKDYYEKSIELTKNSPGYEKVSEDSYTFGDIDGVLHIFNTIDNENNKKNVIQGYIFSPNRNKAYILTGVINEIEDKTGFQNIQDLIKSFSLVEATK